MFEHKSVLVTGAGGSIGSQLCHQIMSDNARKLTLVSLTEAGLYNVERGLRRQYEKYRDTRLVPILGDYGDGTLMAEILPNVDLVIHAGAHKHVPICESNPLAAIDNNVIGTLSLMNSAMDAEVPQFCAISSDKAVNPSSIMGATKRVVETMCYRFNGAAKTKFFVVRFGNVLDSAGSVMPLWREQIASGGPLTLTDHRCERYFMSILEAVDLIVGVIAMAPPGGTFVFDMGKPKRLHDIALDMIKRAGKQIEIKIVGLRPGEKLTEELFYGGALLETTNPRIFRVAELSPQHTADLHALQRLVSAVTDRRSVAAVHTLWEMCRKPEPELREAAES